MQPQYTPQVIEKFWSRVDTSGECWLWTGGKTVAGYGLFYISENRRSYAHRFAYVVSKGAIPGQLLVCHSCDNPSCCRPEHLWLGTDSDNAWDKATKGRSTTGDKHGLRLHPERAARGAQGGAAKLTEAQVIAIRQRYAAGSVTQRQLATEYGVRDSLICLIIHRKRWKHVV